VVAVVDLTHQLEWVQTEMVILADLVVVEETKAVMVMVVLQLEQLVILELHI
jgi:hypothetical protein